MLIYENNFYCLYVTNSDEITLFFWKRSIVFLNNIIYSLFQTVTISETSHINDFLFWRCTLFGCLKVPLLSFLVTNNPKDSLRRDFYLFQSLPVKLWKLISLTSSARTLFEKIIFFNKYLRARNFLLMQGVVHCILILRILLIRSFVNFWFRIVPKYLTLFSMEYLIQSQRSQC